MNSIVSHDERKEQEQKNEQILLSDQHWDSEDDDDDDDSDYTPDRDHNDLDAESVTSENEHQAKDDDDDDECYSSSSGNSPETPVDTPASFLSKRKCISLENNNHANKRTKVNDQEQERRRAKVDAIWAEMNRKDEDKKKLSATVAVAEKQPLDDISSSVNRTLSSATTTITTTTTVSEAKSTTPSTNGGTTNTSAPVTAAAAAAAAPTTTKAPRKKIVRPKSTLSALVSQYNIKVPKMNTLEKSRLDWQGYVDREGIRDDLKYKNKDGYMEKVAFMQRVDDRRLSHLKAGQKATNNAKR